MAEFRNRTKCRSLKHRADTWHWERDGYKTNVGPDTAAWRKRVPGDSRTEVNQESAAVGAWFITDSRLHWPFERRWGGHWPFERWRGGGM